MSTLSLAASRSRRAIAPARRWRLATMVALASTAAVPSAARAADTITVQSVFAAPVSASVYSDPAQNARNLCTPEPAGQRIYGTQADWNPALNNSNNSSSTGLPATAAGGAASTNPAYAPANFPSSANLVLAPQAGASNDLCFGFTLPPDVQSEVLRKPSTTTAGGVTGGNRLQNDPVPVADNPATHVGFNADGSLIDGDDLKSATIEMPAGFLGDPDGGPACSTADFGEGNYLPVQTACYPSQVGTVFFRATTSVLSRSVTDDSRPPQHIAAGGGPNTQAVDAATSLSAGGVVYNLAHGPNELGLLGVSIRPVAGFAPAKFVVHLKLTADGRVTTVVDNAPNHLYKTGDIAADGSLLSTALPYPFYLESIGIRAWGSKADHPSLTADFAQWGTDCSAISADVAVTTQQGVASQMASAPFNLTGCSTLPFLPSVSVTTGERRPAVPTSANVTVSLGQTTSGPRSALLRDAAVTLPQGLALGAQVGARDGGLKLCSAAQFAKDSTVANSCPAGSSAGDLTIVSPLQSRPFVGHVYLGEQSAVGELPALYLEASPSGATAADAPRIKLVGKVSVDGDGRLTTTFTDAPQLRFTTLSIDFAGGDNALFTTPRQCGTTGAQSTFTSSASTTPVTVDDTPLTIDQDCATPGFSPSFSMVPSDTAVGSHAPTTVTISRPDRSPWLSGISVSLPSGFLADLKAASECSADDAAAARCSDASRIATVTTLAGVGNNPLTLTGQMYLSSRQNGDVAGATIVVPAKIGEIDLGNVIVPARIQLRADDAGLTLTTSTPTRFRNLDLNLRSVAVSLDRPGFPLNPTACGPLRATSVLTSDAGDTATPSSDVTYTGCKDRPLKPTIAASLSGDTKALGHPQVNVTVTSRAGDSNLKSTSVVLPAGVSADLNNVKVTCPLAQFNASGCPPNTRVGAASANVSITDDVISGDIYLVHVDGQVLPGLGLSFSGRYTQRVLSQVKIDSSPLHRLVTQFNAIPDLPLTKLALTINGGAKAPIQMSPATCTADSSWDATFGGQGGQTATQVIPYACATIPVPAPVVKWTRKSGIKFTLVAPKGKTIKSAKLTLPSGFTFGTTKTAKKGLKAKLTGGSGSTKFKKGVLTVAAKGAGPTKITVSLSPKGLKLSSKAKKKFKKGAKLAIKLRVAGSNGQVLSTKKTVKVG